jgi:hypothetical protein
MQGIQIVHAVINQQNAVVGMYAVIEDARAEADSIQGNVVSYSVHPAIVKTKPPVAAQPTPKHK